MKKACHGMAHFRGTILHVLFWFLSLQDPMVHNIEISGTSSSCFTGQYGVAFSGVHGSIAWKGLATLVAHVTGNFEHTTSKSQLRLVSKSFFQRCQSHKHSGLKVPGDGEGIYCRGYLSRSCGSSAWTSLQHNSIVLRIRHRVVNEHYLHGSPQLFRVLQRGQKRKPVNLGLQVRVRDICWPSSKSQKLGTTGKGSLAHFCGWEKNLQPFRARLTRRKRSMHMSIQV